MNLKLFTYPGRVIWTKPYSLACVLVPEIRGIDMPFGLPVVPPFIRVGKEDMPQAKPVYALVLF